MEFSLKKIISSVIYCPIYDLSIGSTETKYIKLNTKIQNIFCCVNENLTTFLHTLTGGDKITEGEKKSFKVYTKVKCYLKRIWF